jgi:hypothetical protein
MMRFFTIIFRSFYDLSLYQEAQKQWTGWTLGLNALFFALLTAVGLTAGGVMLHQALLAERSGGQPSVMEEALGQIANQWPALRLEENQLSSDAPMPQVISLDVTIFGERLREDFLTIDTSGTTSYETMKTPMLLTSKELIFQQRGESRIRPLEEMFKGTEQPTLIDRAFIESNARDLIAAARQGGWQFLLFGGLFIWIFLVPALVLVRYLLVIPLSAIGLIIAQVMRRALSYEAAVRVIALALLPVTLVDTLTLFVLGSGVSTVIKALVALGVLTLLLLREPKTSAPAAG